MKVKLLDSMAMMTASALVMILEIVFFRVLVFVHNYQKANSIISVSLLGLAVGGIVGYLLVRRGRLWMLPYCGIITGLGTLACIPNIIYLPGYLEYPILLLVPFLAGSVVIACIFTRQREHHAYFWNLLGAALGVVLVCLLIPRIRSENIILLSSAGCGLLTLFLLLYCSRMWHRLFCGLLGVALLVGGGVLTWANIRSDRFNLATQVWPTDNSEHKVFDVLRRDDPPFLLHSRDSLAGRVDIAVLPSGKSMVAFHEGVMSDVLTQRSANTYWWDPRIPNCVMRRGGRILVVGTSSEGVTKVAKYYSQGNMVGIEINPATVDLMLNELFFDSARAYAGVPIIVTDARTYLESCDDTFDMITLMNTHSRGRAADNAGVPHYLFTKEAFSLMLDRLADDGLIVIEEIRSDEQSRHVMRRILSTLAAAIRENLVGMDFKRHVFTYTYRQHGWAFVINVVRKRPFTPTELDRLDQWMRLQESSKMGRIRGLQAVVHPLQETGTALSEFVNDPAGWTARLDEQGIDVAPITDDKPFLYDVEQGHPQLWRTVGQASLATILLVLIPCYLLFGKSLSGRRGVVLSGMTYFSIIGAAYMMIEIALMQKYQLFLGSPSYSLIVVLSSILLFSGLGGVVSGYLPSRLRHALILLIPILLLAYGWGIDSFFAAHQGGSLSYRVGISLVSLLPLFTLMGVPFPYGLSVLRRTASADHVALLYGVNGAFGTVGVTLSTLLSVYFGFGFTFYLGLGLYALAFVLIWPIRTARSTAQ